MNFCQARIKVGEFEHGCCLSKGHDNVHICDHRTSDGKSYSLRWEDPPPKCLDRWALWNCQLPTNHTGRHRFDSQLCCVEWDDDIPRMKAEITTG